MKPKYIFISDSIILSASLTYNQYDGLAIVIAKTIEIAHKLLEVGYLLRGGISVGSVWHEDRNIFGTAYIEAVEAEKKADHPCIVLTQAAQQHWDSQNCYSPMVMARHDALIVDILLPDYCRNTAQRIPLERTFGQYRAHIIDRLTNLRSGRARAKWEWMASMFNDPLKKHFEGLDLIKIPPDSEHR